MFHTSDSAPSWTFDRRSLILGLAATGLVAPDAFAAVAAGAVESASGAASAEARGAQRALAKGAEVFLGDLVSTSEAGRLILLLGAATRVHLGANTRLRVDKYLAEKSGELRIESGPVLIDRAEGAAPMNLRLRSPFGMVALRGTRVFMGPSNGAFGVFVQRGAVDFTAGGASVRLNAGEGSDLLYPGDKPRAVRRWPQERVIDALISVS